MTDRTSEPRIDLQFLATFAVLLVILPIHLLLLSAAKSSFLLQYEIVLGGTIGLCCYFVLRKSGWLFAAVFIGAVCFQNLYLGWLFNFQEQLVPIPMLILVETKTAILFAGFGISLLFLAQSLTTITSWDWSTRFCLLYLVVIALAFVLSPAPLFSKAAQIRNFLTPVAAWYFGKLCVRKERDFNKILGVFITMGILLSFFSILEIWTKDFWAVHLQKDALLALKGPTADETDFLGVMVPRLYTGIGSPINASFIFALLSLLALFSKRRILASLFGVQAVLTFTKAGIMVGVVGLVFFGLRRNLAKAHSWVRALIIAPLIVFILLSGYFLYVGASLSDMTDVSELDASNTAVGHLRGLFGALQQIPTAPMGHGLGMGGDMSEVGSLTGMTEPSDSDYEHRYEMGGESTLGVMIYQLGLLGVVSFSVWLLYKVQELFRCFKDFVTFRPLYSDVALAALGALFGVCLAAMASESASVPQTGGSVFFLGGMVSGLASVTICRKAEVGA